MVPNGFRRSGRKSLKSLTSNSTGHRLAFLKCCGSFRNHYLSIKPKTLPVSCSIVKARQARKNVEECECGHIASFSLLIRSSLPARFVVCFFLAHPRQPGRRVLF